MHILLSLFLIIFQFSSAVEHIRSFHSDITVHNDSSMIVKETIVAVSDGKTIKHGIVREFPTRYKGRWGHFYEVHFSIRSILLDGKSVPYHVREAVNGKIIYIGDKDIILPPGAYEYEIIYETKRQLGFFDQHDELYWNVTGTGWRLPIVHASARVVLPSVPAEQIMVEGYTGYQGDKGKYYRAWVTETGKAMIETTRSLAELQGLTIIVTWPKGFVNKPTWWQQWWWFLLDNKQRAIGLLGLLILLIFYLTMWVRFRRSQQHATIIPLFYPPEHMSPGLVRYIMHMGYDAKVLASDVVHMAVRGFLTIHREASLFGGYLLKKKADPNGEFEDIYARLSRDLFGQKETAELGSGKTNGQIQAAIETVSDIYGQQTKQFFVSKDWYIFFGVLFTAIVFISMAMIRQGEISFGLVAVIVGYIVAHVLFRQLLRGYSQKGLEIKKEIDGFKMFLATTEEDRLAVIGTPPDKTPELYEKYLPYAIALDVEKQWSKKFAPLFERMAAEGHPYVCVWAIGNGFYSPLALAGLGSAISNSFSTSIASSITAPGTTSGSGGRGSSGGGGGGGGGGGW